MLKLKYRTISHFIAQTIQFPKYTQNKMFIEKNIENSGEEIKTSGTGGGVVVDESYIYNEDKHLTVLKTSVFFSGDGFTVYDCSGQLIFRVDSYGPELFKGELVLMDPSGKCLLTVRRKWPSLHQRWEGFLGERQEGQKPLFSVHRSSIIGRSGLRVDMYNDTGEEYYYIEGSYAQRHCTIFNEEKESMAEIRRKVDSTSNVMLGKDVFCLSLKPGFDGAFAMGLILVLDQVDGHDYSNYDHNHEPIRMHEDAI